VALFWGNVMEQGLGILKNEKVSLAFLVSVLSMAIYAYAWANESFVKQQDFDELKSLLVNHTEEFRITDAAQIVRDLQLQRQVALATGKPEEEITDIDDDIRAAQAYKSCLIEQKPNCKHLKPVP
jgi:hypothetical protein